MSDIRKMSPKSHQHCSKMHLGNYFPSQFEATNHVEIEAEKTKKNDETTVRVWLDCLLNFE